MELILSYIVLDDYVYLLAMGTRGGIILAWKRREVSITDPLFTTNAPMTKVSSPTSPSWWISVVYRPQEDEDKVAFLEELRTVRVDCPDP